MDDMLTQYCSDTTYSGGGVLLKYTESFVPSPSEGRTGHVIHTGVGLGIYQLSSYQL